MRPDYYTVTIVPGVGFSTYTIVAMLGGAVLATYVSVVGDYQPASAANALDLIPLAISNGCVV
jgi:hypothetical protein